MSISVLILTLNEEFNLPECLESVEWSNDIVVLDSHSSDNTVEIATSLGARVIQRRFDDWATHQNWAVENIEFKNEWVFYLDADERMTEGLRNELQSIASDPKENRVAFYCGRKNFFLGSWMKYAMPPGLIMRFFKPSYVRFERLVNPTPLIKGSHGYLKHHLIHYNFSKGITEWINKHNSYSLLEAQEGVKVLKGHSQCQTSVFSTDPASRRKALKNFSVMMPFRAWVKFLYLYILRLGFLDGRPGLTYFSLQAFYEYMIVLKMKEILRCEKGLPI
jgi:glycosyltransferase involved in cell wall biosynthesis